MKVRVTILSTALLALASFSIASGQTPEAPPPPPPPPSAQTLQVQRFIDTMNALANGAACLQGTVKQVESAVTTQSAAPGPHVEKRSPRQTMVLVSAGAASGAAIGAAITKDGRGPMYGAIAGGAAGLIFDLISRKEPATY